MVPRTGPVTFDDLNAELDQAAGTEVELGAALSSFREGTDPDEIEEARGYDKDWPGFVSVESCVRQSNDTFNINVRNNSTKHSYGGTLYYQFRAISGNIACSTSVVVSTLAAGASAAINVACPEIQDTWDYLDWRFRTIVPYNVTPISI